jgi:D-xylonolactonase
MDLNRTPPKAVWPAELSLGEGALWDDRSQRFFCVDIHGCAVHSWTPASDQRQSWKMPERIGWLIPRKDGVGFMAGFQSGIVHLTLEPELHWTPVAQPHPGEPTVRLNDGKADAHGRIWAGSMDNDDPARRTGRLARLDPDLQCAIVETGIYIANGPAIAPDASWMLHTDSFLNTVYRYQMDALGQLSAKTVWRVFTEEEGTPDGMTIDSEGCIWIAFWGGACIRRFSVDAKCLQTIAIPASQVTSISFGGADLQTLLVTTARVGLDAAALEKYPLSGSLFTLRTGVTGLLPLAFG